VPWSDAPDCPVRHRTESGALGPYNDELVTLGFLQRCSAIIHRIVRCAIGLSGATMEQRLLGATVDCKSAGQSYSEEQCAQSQSAEVRGAPDSEQCMSGVALDCPVWHLTVRCRMKTKLQRSTVPEP
jgi:hypothetical protein